jgi:hypothetical protein
MYESSLQANWRLERLYVGIYDVKSALAPFAAMPISIGIQGNALKNEFFGYFGF